jgi:hypothetical protein
MSFSEGFLLAVRDVLFGDLQVYLWLALMEGQEEVLPPDRIMARAICIISLIFFVS